jgi:hypothetical protein
MAFCSAYEDRRKGGKIYFFDKFSATVGVSLRARSDGELHSDIKRSSARQDGVEFESNWCSL